MTTRLNLRAIGWKPFFEQQLSLDHSRVSIVARVSAHHGSQIIMLGAQGEFSIPAQLAGSIDEIAVGDWLVLDAADHRALERLQRQTLPAAPSPPRWIQVNSTSGGLTASRNC
jgi:ribosome biogenesis GTPase